MWCAGAPRRGSEAGQRQEVVRLDSIGHGREVPGARRATATATGASVPVLSLCDIFGRQDEEGWGARDIDRLSGDLEDRFPGATGYSPRNLRYIRAFAAAWPEAAVVQAPLARLPWYHHLALLTKLDGPEQRRWYAEAATEHGWSRDVLGAPDRRPPGRPRRKGGHQLPGDPPAGDSDLAQQATRDPHLFDFLPTAEPLRERDVGRGLVDYVGAFLRELGQDSAFVGQRAA